MRPSDSLADAGIDQLGAARSLVLSEDLGIGTVSDLAAADPAAIEALVGSGRLRGVSRAIIDAWIARARLAVEDERAAHVAPPRPERPPNDNGGWRSIAQFTVEFLSESDDPQRESIKTAVSHHESGRMDDWIGVDWDRTSTWISERLDESLPAVAPVVLRTGEPADEAAAGAVEAPAGGESAGADASIAVHLEARVTDGAETRQPVPLLRTDRPWSIDIRWRVLDPSPETLEGDWLLQVSLGALGSGAALAIPGLPARIPVAPGGGPEYRHVVEVAAGLAQTLPDPQESLGGVVVLSHEARPGEPPDGVWLADLGPVQFHARAA